MQKIFSVPVEILSFQELLGRFFDHINRGEKFYFVSANPEILLESIKDAKYRKILQKSKSNFVDGIGLVGAYYFNKKQIIRFCFLNNVLNQIRFYIFVARNVFSFARKRLAGADFFVKLLSDKRINQYKIFFLGGKLSVLEGAEKYLLKLNKNLHIVGYDDKIKVVLKKKQIKIFQEPFFLAQLNSLKPDIIFIGLGHPKQEYFANYVLSKVKTLKFAMGVGGTFDYIGGKIPRAPIILQNLGIEWLWRFFFEPKRLSRIIKAVIFFPWLYIKKQNP